MQGYVRSSRSRLPRAGKRGKIARYFPQRNDCGRTRAARGRFRRGGFDLNVVCWWFGEYVLDDNNNNSSNSFIRYNGNSYSGNNDYIDFPLLPALKVRRVSRSTVNIRFLFFYFFFHSSLSRTFKLLSFQLSPTSLPNVKSLNSRDRDTPRNLFTVRTSSFSGRKNPLEISEKSVLFETRLNDFTLPFGLAYVRVYASSYPRGRATCNTDVIFFFFCCFNLNCQQGIWDGTIRTFGAITGGKQPVTADGATSTTVT